MILTNEMATELMPPVRPEGRPTTAARPASARRILLYGDFNCPWSYLASRRAALLAADGVDIDWRAVEHDPPHRRTPARAAVAGPTLLGPLLEEMHEVLTTLLPGETLPYALAGFAPRTGAAVAAYAEAHRAGAAELVREVLFDALWLHAFDLGDPAVVHTLIIDTVRSGTLDAGPLPDWEYGTGLTHQPTATTRRQLHAWAAEWGTGGNRTVPTLVVSGQVVRGAGAVAWLGDELVRRGVFPGGARGTRQRGLRS